MVRERTSELEIKSKAVEELNVALKVLLHQVQEDKEHLEQRFVINVNKLVLPYLEKMKKGRLNEEQNSYLDIIRANLKGIMSPFLHNVQQFNLTQRETQVANLIKDGRTTKEIAEVVGVALDAVNSYRNSIRLKLGLNKKKVNLQAYLQSLR
ncbi:MAG: LuxR C-terminal-related transcriptional regulator [Syntrophorhabdales bacterium]